MMSISSNSISKKEKDKVSIELCEIDNAFPDGESPARFSGSEPKESEANGSDSITLRRSSRGLVPK